MIYHRQCQHCGAAFTARRKNATSCSNTCRQAAYDNTTLSRERAELDQRLRLTGIIAKCSPATKRDPRTDKFGLMLPTQAAVDEYNNVFPEDQLTADRLNALIKQRKYLAWREPLPRQKKPAR